MDDEKKDGLVDVRQQNGTRMGKFTVSNFVKYLKTLIPGNSEAEDKLEEDSFYNEVGTCSKLTLNRTRRSRGRRDRGPCSSSWTRA